MIKKINYGTKGHKMKFYQLTALAIRITGIIVLILTIRTISPAIIALLTSQNHANLWIALTPIAFMLSASFCMIVFPSIVALKIIPKPRVEIKDENPIYEDYENLACAIIGLLFLVKSASNITFYASFWLTLKINQNTYQPWANYFWTPENIASISATILELILAIWLLAGAAPLRKLIKWARNLHPQPK